MIIIAAIIITIIVTYLACNYIIDPMCDSLFGQYKDDIEKSENNDEK